MNKRKDNNGRILRTGENQRKDGIYQYRYTDNTGKRQTIYAPDLKNLRAKEAEIQKILSSGLLYQESKITVIELVDRRLDLKQNISYNTKRVYRYSANLIRPEPLAKMLISRVKSSDIQLWIIEQHNNGKKFGTIKTAYSLLKQAFETAVIDGLLLKNPCYFQLSEVIKNDKSHRSALTPLQQEALIEFMKHDKRSQSIYAVFVILLETGLRVSELCGLTIDDVDLENRRVNIDHQLLHSSHKGYFISQPKSSSGRRAIPMTDRAYEIFKDLILNRPKAKPGRTVDGYKNFLFVTAGGNPFFASKVGDTFDRLNNRYNARGEVPVPRVTPHVLRHTFCSNMILSGMDIKSVQYLMGHAELDMTLNTYAHSNYENALKQIVRLGKRSDA